jgi:hypothetical protein
MIVKFLLKEFDKFKINYNSMKEKSTLSEICPRIIQEEERITRQNKDQALHVGSSKRKHDGESPSKPPKKNFKKDVPNSKEKEKGGWARQNVCHFHEKKATIRKIVLSYSNG